MLKSVCQFLKKLINREVLLLLLTALGQSMKVKGVIRFLWNICENR